MPPPVGASISIDLQPSVDTDTGEYEPPASCAAYEGCASLQGNCCPSDWGDTLTCCTSDMVDGYTGTHASECLLEAVAALLAGSCGCDASERLQLVLARSDAADAQLSFTIEFIDGVSSSEDPSAAELAAALLARIDELEARLASQNLVVVAVVEQAPPLTPTAPPTAPPTQPPPPPTPPPCLADATATMYLTHDAQAGSAVLKIDAMLCALEIGATLVLNRGGANGETVTCAGFGSILLDAPLVVSHAAGEPLDLVLASPPSPLMPVATGEEAISSGDGGGGSDVVVPLVVCLLVLLLCCLCLCCFYLARSEQRRRLLEAELQAREEDLKKAEEEKMTSTPSIRVGSVNLGYGQRRWTQVPIDALAGLRHTSALSPGRRSGARRPPPPTTTTGPIPAPPNGSFQSIDLGGESLPSTQESV